MLLSLLLLHPCLPQTVLVHLLPPAHGPNYIHLKTLVLSDGLGRSSVGVQLLPACQHRRFISLRVIVQFLQPQLSQVGQLCCKRP